MAVTNSMDIIHFSFLQEMFLCTIISNQLLDEITSSTSDSIWSQMSWPIQQELRYSTASALNRFLIKDWGSDIPSLASVSYSAKHRRQNMLDKVTKPLIRNHSYRNIFHENARNSIYCNVSPTTPNHIYGHFPNEPAFNSICFHLFQKNAWW